MTVTKDMMPLNNRLLDSDEYSPIDVNTYMDGLSTMGRCTFINKLKTGLATPFQLWSWIKGNNSGVAFHFIWKIPQKTQPQASTDGDVNSATIVGEGLLI